MPAPSPQPGFSIPDSPAAEGSSSSPWSNEATTRINGHGHYHEASDFSTSTTQTGDDNRPGAFSVGTERGYWKRLEHVEVSLIAEKEGWFLQKYKVESDVSR